MKETTENQLTPGQGLPAPVCSRAECFAAAIKYLDPPIIYSGGRICGTLRSGWLDIRMFMGGALAESPNEADKVGRWIAETLTNALTK